MHLCFQRHTQKKLRSHATVTRQCGQKFADVLTLRRRLMRGEEAAERSALPYDYLPSLAAACARRETLRFAALRWMTPFCAARMISGSADFSAASAAVLSPEAIASSTLRTVERMRERRALLTSVRRAITRVALRAEDVLAMVCPSSAG